MTVIIRCVFQFIPSLLSKFLRIARATKSRMTGLRLRIPNSQLSISTRFRRVFFYNNLYILCVVLCSLFIVYYAYLTDTFGFTKAREVIPTTCFRPNGTRNWVRKRISQPEPFKILFWTEWYSTNAAGNEELIPATECQNEFVVTSNKSDCVNADVIIFQLMDMYRLNNIVFPPNREIDVPWILAVQEASIHHPIPNPSRFDRLFNWTWSFRSDSLIHPNFTEKFEKFAERDLRWSYGSDFSQEFLRNKTKVASWVVSNCLSNWVTSKRHEVFYFLSQLGIQVDIYGKCGTFSCPETEDCFQHLGKSYKFYLAFENALCEDYITEKIYHGLFNGMVPIVYALGNVEMNAPPNSYINVLDFSSLSELAERLNYLDQNPQEYFKYFEWRQIYNINSAGTFPYNNCYYYRKMKEYTMKLRTNEDFKYRHVYKSFNDWYTKFYNKKLNRKCEVCLPTEFVNSIYPNLNRIMMYENSNLCD